MSVDNRRLEVVLIDALEDLSVADLDNLRMMDAVPFHTIAYHTVETPTSFKITHPTGARYYMAATLPEKEKWLTLLRQFAAVWYGMAWHGMDSMWSKTL